MAGVFAALSCPATYLIIIGAAITWALFRLSLKYVEGNAKEKQAAAQPIDKRIQSAQ